MYRIELSPGEETAFRSIEELAVAVRRGVVTARARIWHNASGKWLPIQFHPHYKIAASMELTTADLVAGPPVKKLELLTLGELMDPPPPAARPAVVAEKPQQPERSERPEQPARAKRPPEPEPKPRKKAAATSRRTRSGRRPMSIALAGALLIGCAHLAFSAASAALSDDVAGRTRSHRRLITTPTNAMEQGGPETTAAAVLPGLPRVPRPTLHASNVARPKLPAPQPTESAVRGEAGSLESGSEAATPPLGAFRADSEPNIQPAPASDIAAPVPLGGDSLARKMVDSTGKKTLKRILRTIGGTPTAEQTRPKR